MSLSKNIVDSHTKSKEKLFSITVSSLGSSYKKYNLPLDVIYEILLRLPARIVLKFRSICKLFLQLSSSSSFITAHTERCCRANPPPFSMIMCQPKCPPYQCMILHKVKKANTELQIQTSSLALENPGSGYKILEGSCDGLICFRKNYKDGGDVKAEFAVGNPLTNEWTSVTVGPRCAYMLGFYFHKTSGQYRMLLEYIQDWSTRFYRVLTLGSNSLRAIEFVDQYHPWYPLPENVTCSVLIHNNLHCLGVKHGGDLSKIEGVIIVFNTETEKFTHIPMPKSFHWGDVSSSRIIDIQGSLCLIREQIFIQPAELTLWVLQDYEKAIWIHKQVILQNIEQSNESRGEPTYVPLTNLVRDFILVKEEDLLITNSSEKLPLYCLELNAIQEGSPLSLLRGCAWFYRKRFVETLATLCDGKSQII